MKNEDEDDYENILNFPVMLLTGHDSEIYSIEFSLDGKFLASGGKDKQVLLFEAFGECKNFGVLTGHKNAVLEVHWNKDSNVLYSCSADYTSLIHDINYNKTIRKLKGHTGIVNSCFPARNFLHNILVTGADDGTAKIWDSREKFCVNSISHNFQLLSVTTDPDLNRVYTGCLDNIIRVYDTRYLTTGVSNTGREDKTKLMLELRGCLDSITSLHLNNDNTLLLSNSMDEKLSIWDVQSFVYNTSSDMGNVTHERLLNMTNNVQSKGFNSNSVDNNNLNEVNDCDSVNGKDLGKGRLKKVLYGIKHSSEKNLIRSHWGRNSIICSGSADTYVYVFDTIDDKLLYQLPGHLATVNDVQLHPNYPIIASCSNDKTIYIGQL